MAFLRALTFLLLCWTSLAQADEYSAVTQLMRAGKLNDASTLVDQHLANKPRDPQMRFLKGVIQRDSGKTLEAIGTFTKLTEDYPELPEPYNNLAVLYASQNQYDKARAALEMAIRTNPSYATAHENLGDVYAKLAGQAYSKAQQLDSSNSTVAPKFALIRELFNPTGRRSEAEAANPAVAASPSPASSSPAAGAALAPLPRKPEASPAPMLSETTPRVPKPVLAERAPERVPERVTERAADRPVDRPLDRPIERDTAQSDVEAAIKLWASAWADKDVRGYLAAYGRDFVPPNGMTRGEWEAKRESLIASKRSIRIKLSQVKVTVAGNKAQASFVQDYKADTIDSVKPKTLWMAKSGGKWLIVKES